MITGTNHFVSLHHAIRYYRNYGYADVKATVHRKIRDGEIVVGVPRLKDGERLVVLDNGTRYGIISK